MSKFLGVVLTPPSQVLFFLAISAGLIPRPGGDTWQVIWVERWALSILVIGMATIWRLRFTHKIFPVFLTYILAICLCSAYGHLGESDLFLRVVLQQAGIDHLVVLGGFIAFMYWRPRTDFTLKIAAWAVGLAVLADKALGVDVAIRTPLLFNPSMTAVFVVLASSLHPFSLLVIWLTHSWTAFFAFLIGWAVRMGLTSILIMYAASFSIVALIGLSSVHWIPDNGRFTEWALALDLWRSQDLAHKIFGAGAGAFRVFGPIENVTRSAGPSAVTFIWAHNDWLQFAFEYGIIGLSLAPLSLAVLCRRLNNKDLGLFTAYAVAMISDFPTHWAATALVGWTLALKTLEE